MLLWFSDQFTLRLDRDGSCRMPHPLAERKADRTSVTGGEMI